MSASRRRATSRFQPGIAAMYACTGASPSALAIWGLSPARSAGFAGLRLLDFGAIIQLLPGKDGLLHISQIANERVNAVADHLKEGQAVRVKVLEADEKGRLRLSMKAVEKEMQAAQQG